MLISEELKKDLKGLVLNCTNHIKFSDLYEIPPECEVPEDTKEK